ncbi:MAG: tetratricopeptide repeat protein [Longimicrobiales bacterium]
MSVSLEQEIVALQDLHGSSRDPCGTAFVPLADAHRRAGEFDRALELLSEGLSRHPEYTSAHVVTSWVHMDRGAHDEALGTLQLILELDHDNRAGLKGLGKLLNETGDREGAIGHLARLVELEPEDLEASSLLETIQAFEPVEVHEAEPIPEIPAEGPEVPDTDEEIVTRTMGDVYADQGLLYEAIEVYEQLAAAAPDDDEVMARLEELHAEAATPLVVDDPPAAPEPISIDELAPAPEGERPVVSIGSLAPDGERPVVPIALLAPDDAYG